MEFDGAEDFLVGEKMHLGTALLGWAGYLERRNLDTILDLDLAIDGLALIEFEEMLLSISRDRELEPLRKRVDAGNAHAVQAARDLVAVLVELAARMQHAHHDFGRRTLGFVLVVEFDADRNTSAVVGDRDRVVRMDRDDDVVAMSRQGFVDCVIDDLEDHVVKSRAIGGIADIHAGTLTHGLQAFELLDGIFVVGGLLRVLLVGHFGLLTG